jgi:phosphoribosyl-ATP pyrophosphohydrolase
MSDNNPEIVPVVICDDDGTVLDVARQNQKAFEKSIEQGALWVLTAGARVLPYADPRSVALEPRGSWNMARLSGTASSSGQSHTSGSTRSAGAADASDDGRPAAPAAGSDGTALGEVLTSLAGVIAVRKSELPEGSYTTHLFQSGAEKIRKKLGEEAVELILAGERDRKISEAADLLYHLLVLLAADGIELSEIAAELEKR